MVQAEIKGKIRKEKPPMAPIEDEVLVHEIGKDLLGRTVKSRSLRIPGTILLGHLLDGRLKVDNPLKVKVYTEDQSFIAEAKEINEFGFGTNATEAIADLQRTTAELYFSLDKEQDKLGPDLNRVWSILKNKIIKK